ncbi:MAG TPA: RNA 2',3'-cyclic phosphodiesterase [Candidatus Syntrophosphaera sp.]|jgi:2'-5' RNA ligase|nr:RNA 2',3'-cyclic phosphodiesterase [Candidatus Syntrophosphaera sp.]
MKYRCFIALETPDAVHASLSAKLRLLRPQPGVKWVEEQNLHLTLLFLGDVEAGLIPELEALIRENVSGCRTFPLALKGLELFPARAPRLVWASLAHRDEELFRLHKELLGSLRRNGFEPDPKPLKLHITLGRIRNQLPPLLEKEIMAGEVERSWQNYGTLTLYRSVLKPEGPTYHVLEQYKMP